MYFKTRSVCIYIFDRNYSYVPAHSGTNTVLCSFSAAARIRPDLTCTVKAHAPAFSILLANSTVSLGELKRRILALTGTERFLLRVLPIGGGQGRGIDGLQEHRVTVRG